MSTAESERAHREALSSRASTSADRARFWAGLNRYLRTEAEEEHRHAQEDSEEDRGAAEDDPS